MKKLLLLAAFIVASVGLNAQTTIISQTNGVAPDANEGTVGCFQTNSQGQRTGIFETHYFRAYTMNANTDIPAIQVGVGNLAFASGITNFPISVKLYKSSGAFPGSYPSGLTDLSSGGVTANLTLNDTMSLVTIPFSSPISVSSGDVIVAEVFHGAVNGATYTMGVTANETAIGYILATQCGLSTPDDISTLVAGADGKIIIDLVSGILSTQDFFIENFTMYPNPVVDVLNIQSKNGLNANEIKITDMIGKVVKVQKDAASINVSDLSAGTYVIDITTNEGKATSKFIKK